jgi:hypothetical protein
MKAMIRATVHQTTRNRYILIGRRLPNYTQTSEVRIRHKPSRMRRIVNKRT